MVFVYFTVLFFLVDPALAHAWGPGMHLDFSLSILQNAALCLPAIVALIKKYPNEFIYGSVSPDIITGKKYAGAMHHCHNWTVGKLILEESKTDAERASAWGYLSHLAADTVAHNYFVPYYTLQSFQAITLGHAYWEMRFDIFVPESSWAELGHVIRHNTTPFDHLLERVLKKTLFSFRTNKKIFNSILILHKMKQLRFGLRSYGKISRWSLPKEEAAHFKKLATETVFDFLKNPEKAKCLKADPSGQRKLLYAAEISRELRGAVRTKKMNEEEIKVFLAKVKANLFDDCFRLNQAPLPLPSAS